MQRTMWFERKFIFGLPLGMLPFYLDRLEGTAFRIRERVKNQSEDALSLGLNNKWSIKQHIGHLAEVDEIADRRIDEMLSGSPSLSPAVFEPRMDYDSRPVNEIIAFFENGRNRNILKYRSLAENELGKSSLHPRLKLQMSPVDLAWFDAEHDDHHLVTIREVLIDLSK